MTEYFDIWKFLAGLGVFLFGLSLAEQALKNLAGRSFKRFLRTQTNLFMSTVAGVVATVVLQSSSVVSLMVLAFVGAGILSLRNAIGIIFGTNLGTTFTGWIVTTLGFQVGIESFALPLLAVGGLLMGFFPQMEKFRDTSSFLLGFGLLFIGLQFMKSSVDYLSGSFDTAALEGMNPYLFFPVGLVLTAIIHSSSAMMVITLSGLNAGIIPLDTAAVIMVGSDLGTTATAVLGAVNGTPDKKRVAASHVLFNVVTCVVALALMYPLLWFIGDVLGIADPLYVLVAFHSGFNFLGLMMLMPFTGRIARLLEGWFTQGETLCAYIGKVPTTVPDAAIEALGKEIAHLVDDTFALNIRGLRLRALNHLQTDTTKFRMNNYLEHYARLKELEGEIVAYYLRIQGEKLEESESDRLNTYSRVVGSVMHSAKAIKDIEHNVREFSNSSNDAKLELFTGLQNRLAEFYTQVHRMLHDGSKATRFETLNELAGSILNIHEKFMGETYTQAKARKLSEIEISTLLNVNREVYNSNRAFLVAMADFLLTKQEAEDFGRMAPVRY